MKYVYPANRAFDATARLVVEHKGLDGKKAQVLRELTEGANGCELTRMNGPTVEVVYAIRGPSSREVPGAFFIAPDDFKPQPWATTVRVGETVTADNLRAGGVTLKKVAAPLLSRSEMAELERMLQPPVEVEEAPTEQPEEVPKKKKARRAPTRSEANA